MKKLFIFLVALMAVFTVKAQELYTVFDASSFTLTYYYDNQRSTHDGIVDVFSENAGTVVKEHFLDYNNMVNFVVFDPSIANLRLKSTTYLFGMMEPTGGFVSLPRLARITGMEYLNTSETTNMSMTFAYLSGLSQIDLSHFNTSNVTDMSGMFANCSALQQLDFGKFDTRNVTTMQGMFGNCYGLSQLDLNKFDVGKITDFSGMFYQCYGLQTIYCNRDWTTQNAYGEAMFYDCNSLVGGQGTKYKAQYTGIEYAHPDGGTAAPGYFTERANKAAYRVFNESTKTLTFYYDDKMANRESAELIDVFENYKEYAELVEAVVFDPSFAGYKLTGDMPTKLFGYSYYDEYDRKWRYPIYNVKTISGMEYLDTSEATDMHMMFSDLEHLTSLDVSHFDTHNVTDMSYMFNSCESLTSLDLSNFDTQNVTDMSYMFSYCKSLKSLDLSNFDTRNVTNMKNMFDRCESLTSLDVSNFDTQNVTDMTNMFHDCILLRQLDISHFDTYNVGNMRCMFMDCKSLQQLDVSNFYTPNVTDMTSLFAHCELLTSIDVSNFDTRNVEDMSDMFYYCKSLKKLDLSNFDTRNVKDIGSMFEYCEQLTELDITHFDFSNCKGWRGCIAQYVFSECPNLKTIYCNQDWREHISDAKYMFENTTSIVGGEGTTYDAESDSQYDYAHPDGGLDDPGYFTLKKLDAYTVFNAESRELTYFYDDQMATREGIVDLIESREHFSEYNELVEYAVFDESFKWLKITGDMPRNLFGYYTSQVSSLHLTQMRHIIGMEFLDVSEATDLTAMFYKCSSLTNLDLNGFDTRNVKYMTNMFMSCESLTMLDLSGFYTRNVTDMSGMFEGCAFLSMVDLNSFDTRNVTSMSHMFLGCNMLSELNLSNFSTQNVQNMQKMFDGCNALSQIDVSGFDTQNVHDMYRMFAGCQSLGELDLRNFDMQKVENIEEMFYGCYALRTIYCNDNWSGISKGDAMFGDCYSLSGGMDTNYSMEHTGKGYAHPDGGTAKPGYFTQLIPDSYTIKLYIAPSDPDDEATEGQLWKQIYLTTSYSDMLSMFDNEAKTGYMHKDDALTVEVHSTNNLYVFDHWSDNVGEAQRTFQTNKDRCFTLYVRKNDNFNTVRLHIVSTGTDDKLTEEELWQQINYEISYSNADSRFDEENMTVMLANGDALSVRIIGDAYMFDHWGDGSEESYRVFQISEDADIVLYVTKMHYHVSAHAGKGGKADVSGNNDFVLDEELQNPQFLITLTATPNADYVFAGWIGEEMLENMTESEALESLEQEYQALLNAEPTEDIVALIGLLEAMQQPVVNITSQNLMALYQRLYHTPEGEITLRALFRPTAAMEESLQALINAINKADEYYNSIKDVNEYANVADNLQKAIADAEAVLNNPESSKAQIDAAAVTLNTAVEQAKADIAVITGLNSVAGEYYNSKVVKIIENGRVVIIMPDGKRFDANGRTLNR